MDNRHDILLLNTIQTRLGIIFQKHPHLSIVAAALEHVGDLLKSFSKEVCILLINELTSLQTERIWGDSEGGEDDDKVLDELRAIANQQSTSPTTIGDDIKTIKIDLPNRKIPQILRHDLPPEIMDCINETYLLHTVAMHSSKVLPPGKSILSIFSSRAHPDYSTSPSASSGDDHSVSKSLTQEVSQIVFKAFWDEAFISLSSPSAAIQLSRLRLLYLDLHKAIESLLPPSLPIMYTLTHPLSPTSSPLVSASLHLEELLVVLQARCAPIRDVEFDELSNCLKNVSYRELPRVCVDVIKGILQLADLMKADMANFITGTWTEQEAVRWLRQQAISRERNFIINMFTLSKLKELYQAWLSEVEIERQVDSDQDSNHDANLINRLIRAFAKNQPVSPFPPSTNLLPPPMMYLAFDFIRVQNLLQALVITACLRIVAHPYLKEKSKLNDWLTRIWTLLELEINTEMQNTHYDDDANSGTIGTRLVNLEDEVISVSQSQGAEGEHLRETVRRILRVEDPAFKLLHSRLLEGIRKRVLVQSPVSRVPNSLTSGRLGGESFSHDQEQFQLAEEKLFVKGFEEPVLMSKISDVTLFIRTSLVWFKEAWSGILL